MPSLVGSLYVSLTADFAPFSRNMRSAEGVVSTSTASIRRSMGMTEQSVTRLQRTMNTGIRPGAIIAAGRTFNTVEQRANLLRGSVFALTAAFGGLGAALTTNVITRYFDSFTGLSNQIRVVADGSADLAAQIAAVQRTADGSRFALSATATLYSRISKAAPEEGVIKTLRRVETISKALQLGGATAQEASSAAVQFSQAIASNRLGGEELRAVLETPLGLELARGLGVTIGKLREMGYAGELTADVLFGALDRVAGSVDQKFAASVATIDQALTVADNRITVFAGKLDQTYGITRLLTSGIIGLADNLETVVPLLAATGLALGSGFAGRGLGGFVGRRAGIVRDEIARRKENLRLAREEYSIAQQAREQARAAQREAMALSTARAGDFASPAAKKELARAEAQLSKETARYNDLLAKQREAQRDVGAVTVQTTVGTVRAAERLAAAQNRVNKLKERDAQLSRDQEIAARRAAVQFTVDTPGYEELERKRQGERDLVRIAAERGRIVEQLAAAEARVTREQISLTERRTQAEVRAAEQIAAARTREAAIRRQLGESLARQEQLRGGVGAAMTGVATSGRAGIFGRQLDASDVLNRTNEAAAKAASTLTAADRAARGLSVGLGIARRAGESFIGFLGGPWGFAFTAAIGLMTIFGIRAAQTAQEVARARAIMSEELERLGQTPAGAASPDAQIALISDRIIAETERLDVVKNRLEDIREEFKDIASTALFSEAQRVSPQEVYVVEEAWRQVSQEINNGSLAIGNVINRLRELGVSDQVLAAIESDIRAVTIEGRSLEIVLRAIQQRITQLDGQRANVEIAINVLDPLGVFSGKRQPHILARELAEQYKQYGAGQRAMREQIQLKEFRESVLNRAGETDKVKNTPQKIRDRTQALLEEAGAIGLTRAEAEKLAREELNLEEATRLAGQGSRGAAKDYENFANKIAELRERAAASGLSELDQEVVQFAERLKNGSEMMKQYIAAVESGDLSKAPKELRQVRDALLEIRANSAVDTILQQYGTGAQLAGRFAEMQEILNIAVANGDITAEQASLAWADFISQFGKYQWVDQLTNAFVNFASTALTNFDDIEGAAVSLLQEIGKIILQLTVLEPLRNSLRGFFGGLVGGGTSFFPAPPAPPVMTGLWHGGGDTRRPKMHRMVSPSVFAGAPRFHEGLLPNEIAAVLEKGETVLSRRQTAGLGGLLGGIASSADGGRSVLEVALSPDLVGRILQESAGQSMQITKKGIREYHDDVMPARVKQIVSDPNAA